MIKVNDCWDHNIHKQMTEYSSGLLWRFIQRNAQEGETEEALLNLTGLTKRDLKMLANIRFLLSAEVIELLNVVAPKIIYRLSKESVNEHITERGLVRGRINWQRTVGARAQAGNDSTIFVYSRRAQIFDLPENRLFLFIIRQINEKARTFVTDEYLNLTWYAEIFESSKWVERVSLIASKTSRIQRNPYISKIGSLYEITDKLIQIAKRCRQSHYKELAIIAERYMYSQSKPVSYLYEELSGNILEPLNKDTLYEIAVLFKTIYTAMDCGWREKKIGLIGGSTKTASTLIKNNCELKIYFQKLPQLLAQNSDYGDIMTNYGLSDKLRRPDIILELSNGHQKNIIIIEVKRSSVRGYLVDGTYKLLGYIKDFNRVNTIGVSIKGFLVGWSGIKPCHYSDAQEVHLFNWSNYKEGLSDMLSIFEQGGTKNVG